MELKQYLTVDEIKRDFTKLIKLVETTDDMLEKFQLALAYIQVKGTASIQLRDSENRRIDRVNIPKRALKKKEVLKNFKVLEDLLEYEQLVNNMLVQLEQHFEATPSVIKMLKHGKKLKVELTNKLDKANKIADDLAKRSIPTNFKNWSTRIYNYVKQRFEGRYATSDQKFMVALTNDGFNYSTYLRFVDLSNDDHYTYPQYYIVISYLVRNNGESNYYATSMSDFKLPGKFRYGAVAADFNQLKTLVNDQLAVDHFVSKLLPKKLPLTSDQLNFTSTDIEKTMVKDNKIYITLKKGIKKSTAAHIRAKLLGDLQIMVKKHHPRNQDMIRYRVYKSGNNWKIIFAFTLPKHYRGFLLKDRDHKILREQLGLTPKQIQRVQDALDE